VVETTSDCNVNANDEAIIQRAIRPTKATCVSAGTKYLCVGILCAIASRDASYRPIFLLLEDKRGTSSRRGID
jgi:hypothetical protein